MQINAGRSVLAAGSKHCFRHLAVMPPATGKRVSHLIVGTEDSSELLVLSLPGLALVHSHVIEGMQLIGMAADPFGKALVVHDFISKAFNILAWPLPGMPPLK